MNESKVKMSKKNMTRLLDESFRKKILSSVDWNKYSQNKGIPIYARYIVDTQITQRIDEYKDDKASGWGFPQLNIMCAVRKNEVVTKFFEFKTVNHFLKEQDGDTALDVVKCMLVLWAREDKTIVDFDLEKIKAELARLDKVIAETQEKLQKAIELAKQIEEEKQKVAMDENDDEIDYRDMDIDVQVE